MALAEAPPKSDFPCRDALCRWAERGPAGAGKPGLGAPGCPSLERWVPDAAARKDQDSEAVWPPQRLVLRGPPRPAHPPRSSGTEDLSSFACVLDAVETLAIVATVGLQYLLSEKYVCCVQPERTTVQPGADRKPAEYQTTSEDGITKIMFNRPTKKNAASTQMYEEIKLALKAASKDDSIITVLTGNARFREKAYMLKAYAKIPPNALKVSKEVIRNREKEKLHAVNAEECITLQERWLSEECTNGIMNFLSRKA
ncbi:Enoyl-CoA delta isomerase 2, mitochondrial [Tupaia chinensis]|uniref:Enoyl-CoA delta isomerase 2, mitochondrial n=1 Tax=Tupaia chinensis TaxID=246437 RepID=L9L3R2_TUPCH|nr:Enoyl-CoA delta isomerase 2, mitochondrial [Tupaia chinensis]